MWLGQIPWAGRVWALPLLTVLAPSEPYYRAQGRQPKKLTDWARQLILSTCGGRRWLPDRDLIVVGDGAYAALDLLHCCRALTHPVTFITRLRLDARLYDPPPARQPRQRGRSRIIGPRQTPLAQLLDHPDTPWTTASVAWYGARARTVELTSHTALWYVSGKTPLPLRWVLIRDPQRRFQPQALLCTDPNADPAQIVQWFVLRWQLEVTFREVRTHLGVETQRQWSHRAIACTTPVLLGLFSWVTLAAHQLQHSQPMPARTAAWYPKPKPTFSDALALVRCHLWPATAHFAMSPQPSHMSKIQLTQRHVVFSSLAYAA